MGTKTRVLVVDDQPGIVKVLRIQLRIRGFDVITAAGGKEAVELARWQNPDVILLDILMPDVSGFDVIDQVRAFSRVPVIVFSANSQHFETALKKGADASLSKPFHPDQLAEKIKTVLDGRKRP